MEDLRVVPAAANVEDLWDRLWREKGESSCFLLRNAEHESTAGVRVGAKQPEQFGAVLVARKMSASTEGEEGPIAPDHLVRAGSKFGMAEPLVDEWLYINELALSVRVCCT